MERCLERCLETHCLFRVERGLERCLESRRISRVWKGVWKGVWKVDIFPESGKGSGKVLKRGGVWKGRGFQTGKGSGKVLWKGVWKGGFGDSGKVLKRYRLSSTFPFWKGTPGVAVIRTAKSARPATNLPSATFLQPFYHMQHSCNIICNMLYSATYLQHMLSLAATRIACNIVCNIVCHTVIVCNTSFHQTPFEDALSAGDSNSKAY